MDKSIIVLMHALTVYVNILELWTWPQSAEMMIWIYKPFIDKMPINNSGILTTSTVHIRVPLSY